MAQVVGFTRPSLCGVDFPFIEVRDEHEISGRMDIHCGRNRCFQQLRTPNKVLAKGGIRVSVG